jgi:ATP-dependent Clp protease, protease subunit
VRNRLLSLLKANARKGTLRAEASSNTIWIYDIIVGDEFEADWFGGVSPIGFRKQLDQMTGPVTVRVNSPGGDVFGGIAIAQAIREYKDGVTVQVDGIAASIASIIAIAAKQTVMAPGSFMMIHKAWTIMWGNADQLMHEAGVLEKVDQSLADQYSAKAGEGDWLAAMAAETWYGAAEAVELGLADSVAGSAAEAQNRVSWDLSAFERAPEIAAVAPEPEQDEIAELRRRTEARLRHCPA